MRRHVLLWEKSALRRRRLTSSISDYCLHGVVGGSGSKCTIYILLGMSSKHSYCSLAPCQRYSHYLKGVVLQKIKKKEKV